MVLGDPRGAEERDGGHRDPLHGLEAALELARDLDDALVQAAVGALEESLVVH
jgi:hypothetical protein